MEGEQKKSGVLLYAIIVLTVGYGVYWILKTFALFDIFTFLFIVGVLFGLFVLIKYASKVKTVG